MERVTDMEKIYEIVKEYFDQDITLTLNEYPMGVHEVIDHPFIKAREVRRRQQPEYNPNANRKDSNVAKFLGDGEKRLKFREEKWNYLRNNP